MNIYEATQFIDEMFHKKFNVLGHISSVSELGYKFKLSRGKRRLGYCNYFNKTIAISKIYIEHNPKEEITDTILHEFAHAFSFFFYGMNGTGHCYNWKKICSILGCQPKRLADSSKVVMPQGNWCLINFETNEIYIRYHRKPTKVIKNCKNMWIIGKKDETRGKLRVVQIST